MQTCTLNANGKREGWDRYFCGMPVFYENGIATKISEKNENFKIKEDSQYINRYPRKHCEYNGVIYFNKKEIEASGFDYDFIMECLPWIYINNTGKKNYLNVHENKPAIIGLCQYFSYEAFIEQTIYTMEDIIEVSVIYDPFATKSEDVFRNSHTLEKFIQNQYTKGKKPTICVKI